jgi:hypothetical protein
MPIKSILRMVFFQCFSVVHLLFLPAGSGGFSSGGGFGGASKSSYPSGASYRAPSGTMGRFASPGVARSSAPRPQASIPRATQTYPTRVQYSTTYNNYYGSSYGRRGSGSSMLLAGGAGLLGGYYLGSMMGRLSYPGYGYGSVEPPIFKLYTNRNVT